MNIGTHLREARERRGVTLHQVAGSTKLSTSVLQHIERNDFSRLPGGIFTRGYLRGYAAAVGVDPEEVVREYLVQFPAEATDKPPTIPARAIDSPRAGWQFLAVVAISAVLVASCLSGCFSTPPYVV